MGCNPSKLCGDQSVENNDICHGVSIKKKSLAFGHLRSTLVNKCMPVDYLMNNDSHKMKLTPSSSSLMNETILQEIVRSFPFAAHTDKDFTNVENSNSDEYAQQLNLLKSPKIKVLKQFDWPVCSSRQRETLGNVLLYSKIFRRRRPPSRQKDVKKGVLQLMVMKSIETVVPMVVPLELWLQQRLSSWVQLSGHKGTIVPASEKTLWKKCGKSDQNFEAEAYCQLMNDICRPFVPRFYKEVEYCLESFIEIEDLTRYFESPAIMDIKLGTRTFLESEVDNPKKRPDLFFKMIQLDPTEPTLEENAEKAITKLRYMQFRERESATSTLGFRIDGIKLTQVLRQFFDSGKNTLLTKKAVQRLKDMRFAIEKSPFFQTHEVIGSSLLVLYDDNSLNIYMIDFAKAMLLSTSSDNPKFTVNHRSPWTLSNKEDGYLFGMDSLIEISNKHKIVTSLAAGAIAGAAAKSTIAPLDRCKINFQVSRRPFSAKAAARFLIDSYKNDGLASLWRGNSATMIRVVPFAAIQFCAHEQWRRVLSVDRFKKPTPLRRYVAGSLAGVTATTLTYPLDVARARLAVSRKNEYTTLLDVFVKTYKLEGPRTLFRGLTPTLAGVIPYAGTSFFTYESLKLLYFERTGRRISAFERMLFGACSGLIGQSASYPFDIVRRRMQTGSNLPPTTSIYKIMSSVIKEEGVIGGLYKGLSMNWVKGPIAVAISFTTFDTVLRFLRRLDVFQTDVKSVIR